MVPWLLNIKKSKFIDIIRAEATLLIMASSIVGSNWNGLHLKPYAKMSQTITWNPMTKLYIPTPKDQTLFACNNIKR